MDRTVVVHRSGTHAYDQRGEPPSRLGPTATACAPPCLHPLGGGSRAGRRFPAATQGKQALRQMPATPASGAVAPTKRRSKLVGARRWGALQWLSIVDRCVHGGKNRGVGLHLRAVPRVQVRPATPSNEERRRSRVPRRASRRTSRARQPHEHLVVIPTAQAWVAQPHACRLTATTDRKRRKRTVDDELSIAGRAHLLIGEMSWTGSPSSQVAG